ncbi:Thioesterase/thiol ester dehydrase-isomerase [Amniculicola lignicola CBS 123094]|uniref:Thioesterase/thiol ester dehydrase-isomerase n=1 Tax=Amniculicola lignicola CBS 123094 TaxID=1392246 RepID=A0A6A5WUN2_9PLEO|nr:Thioesterase/thiol ester dehydrase-isomerase [Amniculicola lignicola CBS 123094]
MYPVARSAAWRYARARGKFSPLRRVGGLQERVLPPVYGRAGSLIWLEKRSQSSISESQATTTTTTAQTKSRPPKDEPPPPRNKRRFLIRATTTTLLTLLAFSLGFAMAAAPAYSTALEVANPPTDEETLTLFIPTTRDIATIETQIFSHPLTQSLLADPKYIASRPHLKIPEALRAQNLTGGTLLGPDKIAVPPLQFTTPDGSKFISFQWVGHGLCGHPGIIHGGLLATLLDEGLARCCFPALPNKVAVTATLNVQYKKPAMAGQILILRAETTKVEGRKAWVKGTLETLGEGMEGRGVVVTEAEALFIEPRQAASMRRVVN